VYSTAPGRANGSGAFIYGLCGWGAFASDELAQCRSQHVTLGCSIRLSAEKRAKLIALGAWLGPNPECDGQAACLQEVAHSPPVTRVVGAENFLGELANAQTNCLANWYVVHNRLPIQLRC
jgi:hypothetical protein